MKKIFTLMAAALFAASANAQETKSVNWQVEDAPTAATPISVKGDDAEVLQIAFGTLDPNKAADDDPKGWKTDEGKFKIGHNGDSIEFVNYATTAATNGNNKADLAADGSSIGNYVAFVPKHDGTLIVAVHNQGGKVTCLYENGVQLAATLIGDGSKEVAFNGAENLNPLNGDANYTGGIQFAVKAGNSYTISVNGSKGRWSGVIYDYDPSTGATGGDDQGNTGGGDDQGYRYWDFTNWSEATVANLKADAAASETEGWSDVEKLENNTTAEASKDNCFWAITTPNENGELLANGVVIEELKGLVFGANVNNRGLAIAVNYPVALSTYKGGAYLWLGGANKKFFTIPGVKGGTKIKMGVESHKDSDARGVDLLVGGTSIGQFTPKEYAENTWTVEGDETVDVVVDNTNGCHIYFIEVGEKTETGIQNVVKTVSNGAIYNLAGQKVDENYKGVVIKNGKKVVLK